MGIVRKKLGFYKRKLLNIQKTRRIKRAYNKINRRYLDDWSKKGFDKKIKYMRFLCKSIDSTARIAGGVFITANLHIGKNVFIGRNFKAEGCGTIIIEDNVSLSSNVTIITGDHYYGTCKKRAGVGFNNTIIIKEGTWVGNSVLILRNTTIGKGSVVAAGSVVINSCPDNVMIAGNPAIIKKELPN